MIHSLDSKPDIHHVSVLGATSFLEADTEQGLTFDEVASRQRKFGPNRMAVRCGGRAVWWLLGSDGELFGTG